jgi:integrase
MTNKSIKRKVRGSITKRSLDSLSIIVYVKSDTPNKPRQLWETVKRQHDADGKAETDAELRDRAERRLAELIRKQDDGGNIVGERLTVETYLKGWLDEYTSDHRDSTTPITYRYLIDKHVIPRVGSVLLPKLTIRQVENIYRQMRDAGLKGKTRQHVHRVLSLALKRAKLNGYVRENVCDNAESSLYRPEAPKLHKITKDEAKGLVDAAADYPEIAALVPLLAYTGLRIGEALGLRWSDINFDGDTLTVAQARKRIGKGEYGKPKTEKSARTVPMLPIVSTALYTHRERQTDQRETDGVPAPLHNLVFTRADGSPIDHDYVTHRWQHIREKVGLATVRIHDLRHFAATTMADAGVPAHHVSAVLGHSNVTTTANRYYRSNDDDKRSAIETLGRSLEASTRTLSQT